MSWRATGAEGGAAAAKRFSAVQITAGPRRRDDKRGDESDGRTDTSHIEEQRASARDSDPRVAHHVEGATREENAQFGRADAGERQPEDSAGVRREKPLGGDQEISGEKRGGNTRVHPAGCRHPGEQHGGARQIDHMIDVVTVPGPQLIANPRDGAVEAVAEPVDSEK
jgi:hypothetical protein